MCQLCVQYGVQIRDNNFSASLLLILLYVTHRIAMSVTQHLLRVYDTKIIITKLKFAYECDSLKVLKV